MIFIIVPSDAGYGSWPEPRAIAAALPRHLTSGRRLWRLHHNSPCSGSARKGATNLISGIFQPAKVAVHPAGSDEAGRASRN